MQTIYPTKDLDLDYTKNTQNSTINNLIRKCAEDRNRHFSREYGQIAQTHMYRCSMSSAITEMQFKTTSYHYTPNRIGKTKDGDNSKSGKDAEKLGRSQTVSGNVK